MKKIWQRIGTVLLLTLSILGSWSGLTNYQRLTAFVRPCSADTINIATIQDFLTLAQNCTTSADYSIDLTVNLTTDLDFATVEFIPLRNFAGTLQGNGHTLQNISVSDGATATAVFHTVAHTAALTDLNFKNLQLDGDNYVGLVGTNYGTLCNITIDGKINGKNYVGGLAAYNANSHTNFNNDDDEEENSNNHTWNATSYGQIINCQNNAVITGQTFVGGIAGNNVGIITACTNHNFINGQKSATNAAICNLGGITGNNDYRVMNCTNHAAIDAGDDSTAVGGICGLATGEIYYAFNGGNVHGTHYAGGICGLYGTLTEVDGGETEDEPMIDLATHQITYTANQANITAVSHAGGIIGYAATTTLTLNNAANDGDITITAGNYAGGIVGYAQNVSIRSVTSAGAMTAKGLNAGKYVGGIAGEADQIIAAHTTATIQGNDYLGGIVGYARNIVQDCYSNALVLPTTNSIYTGLIAGTAHAFNASMNTFGDSVKNNYYLGTTGGIENIQYAAFFNHAAEQVTTSQLTTMDINPDYWQNDSDTTYPTLRYLQTVEAREAMIADRDKKDTEDDKAAWNQMFDDHVAIFQKLTQANAKMIYMVTFMEWSQDNGDLYDADGVLLTDNFDPIKVVRITADADLPIPDLVYATHRDDGKNVYQGDQALYYVTLSAPQHITSNTTIYAQYIPIVTTLTTPDRRILVEGEFAAGTTVELITDGDAYHLQFMCDAQPVNVTNATVKIKPDDTQNTIYVLDGEQSIKVKITRSGDYLAFQYNGHAFRLATEKGFAMPVWGWLLISVGFVAVLTAVIVSYIVIKHHRKQPAVPQDKHQLNTKPHEKATKQSTPNK